MTSVGSCPVAFSIFSFSRKLILYSNASIDLSRAWMRLLIWSQERTLSLLTQSELRAITVALAKEIVK